MPKCLSWMSTVDELERHSNCLDNLGINQISVFTIATKGKREFKSMVTNLLDLEMIYPFWPLRRAVLVDLADDVWERLN